MKKIFSFLVAMIVSASVAPAALATTWASGENLLVSENIFDDAYFFAGNTQIDADVFGDLYAAGGYMLINGNVQEDLVITGGQVRVLGDVGGDLRVAGGQVQIFGNIEDDLVVAGGQVEVSKATVIGGSLLGSAGFMNMEGEIQEDLQGGFGVLNLNGSVNGDVVVTIEDTLNVSPLASVGGDLKYSAFLEKNVPQGVVAGEVSFNQFDKETLLESLTFGFILAKFISFLSALFITFLIVLIAPKTLIHTAKLTREKPWRTLGMGFLTMSALIVLPILLVITIIGIPLAVILLAGFVIALVMAKIAVAAIFTSYFLEVKKTPQKVKLFGALALSLFIYFLLTMLPLIGWIINIFLVAYGIGALFTAELSYWKILKKKGVA